MKSIEGKNAIDEECKGEEERRRGGRKGKKLDGEKEKEKEELLREVDKRNSTA